MDDDTPELPQALIALAPYMEELLELREEVVRMRMEKTRVPPGAVELFEKGGWGLKQDRWGMWSYDIPLKDYKTGGMGFDSAEDAIVAAMKRTREMVFAEDEEDDY